MGNRAFAAIARILQLPEEQITMDMSPDSVESWDSMKHMNLILELEKEFDVQFTEEQIVTFDSVELIVETLRELGCL